jgi:ribosomal protein S18 acetylase RimI-like enzyme
MIIRRATSQDARELTEFNINMARETEGMELKPEVIGAGVRAMIENPQMGFYLVVELDNGIQASLMVTTEWSDWRDGLFWWIQSVYVRPEHRRRGVYRALYRFVHDLAGKRPEVCGFRLYVEQDNRRAQKTYRSLGMNRTRYLVYEASTREPGVREP